MTTVIIMAASDIDPESRQYNWAVATDPRAATLSIYARDPTVFEALYQDEVLLRLEDLGFDSCLTQPIPVYHGEDCAYGFADDFPTKFPTPDSDHSSRHSMVDVL
jgi:hypothetical protein